VFRIPHNAGTPRLIVPKVFEKPADDGGLFCFQICVTRDVLILSLLAGLRHKKAAAQAGGGFFKRLCGWKT
jgi:hypothetical protein